MAADLSWIPESVKTILVKSEAHYRAVGFKRTAHHMKQALDDAAQGKISEDFFVRYVKLLKDDVDEFVRNFDFEDSIKTEFAESVKTSIDYIGNLLSDLDGKKLTPVFNGTTTPAENARILNDFISENGIVDPIAACDNPYDALEMMDRFYDVVYNNVYLPGKEFLVAQLGVAVNHDEMIERAEEILSIGRVLVKGTETVSDFRYAYQFPGEFSKDEKSWVLNKECSVPVESVARWPIIMYYKVPIVTVMLPVHNVLFFTLVQKTIAEQKISS